MRIRTASLDTGFLDKIRQLLPTDPTFREIWTGLDEEIPPPHLKNYTKENGLLIYHDPMDKRKRICVPKVDSLRTDIIHDHHDAITSGHFGHHKTYNSIARVYFWPKMGNDIKAYV